MLEVTAAAAAAVGASPSKSGAKVGAERSRVDSEADVAKEKAGRAVDSRETKDGTGKKKSNRVRKTRIEQMMSKAELARRANLSVLTIDRVEKGFGCRMDTKRKILEALGLSLADRVRVFGEEE